MPMRKTRRFKSRLLGRMPWLRHRIQCSRNRALSNRAYFHRSRQVQNILPERVFGCHRTDGPKHILVITVDCMRKSNLSLYGYRRETTPFMRSLSEELSIFNNAVSASPWTFPAVASILTGLYPHHHGAVHDKELRNFDVELPNVLGENIATLPEILSFCGFECAFMSAIATAELPVRGCFKDTTNYFAGANRHITGLLRWLSRNTNRKTFTYLHLGDLHTPVNAPQEYRNIFGRIAPIDNLETWDFQDNAEEGGPTFEAYRENRTRLYDCAMRFVDSQIEKLFLALRELRIGEDSLVFITADHGEEFWEHAKIEKELFHDPRGVFGVGHGHNLFQEIINVPLMCIGKGASPGVFDHNVSLIDLFPTILNLCGVEHDIETDGCSLLSVPDNNRIILSEGVGYGYEKKAFIKGALKVIHSEGDNVDLLFDLSQDPHERNDLSQIRPDAVSRMTGAAPQSETVGQKGKLEESIREQLQTLGYM